MHVFDFILILFSFVYAAAVTHLLATAGEIIIAAKRIRLSWFNAGWMLVSLLATCAWWIGLWDLHTSAVWDIGSIAFFFLMAASLYLFARLVSPRIPHDGEIDLQRFHIEEGRKYMIGYTIISLLTVGTNAVLGEADGVAQWVQQNDAVIPMTFAAASAAIFVKRPWVQGLALVVQIAGWVWYFAVFQSSLSG